MLRVAVIGLGYWGPNLVRNLATLDACSSVVVSDVDHRRVKATQSMYPFAEARVDYQAVLDDPDIAAVVVATPVPTHASLAAMALRAGKNVLVEKPLATTFDDARDLLELARSRRLLVMAGHTFLYSAPVIAVRELVRLGTLGEALYIHATRVNLGIHQSDVSVLWDLAPHDLSIVVDWLGEVPTAVSATGRSSLSDRPVDVAFVDLRFESGVIANLHLSWLAPTKLRRITFVGTNKMAVYEDTNAEEPVRIYDKGLHLSDPRDYGQYQLTYRTGDMVAPRVGTAEPLRVELDDFLGRVERGETAASQEQTAAAIVATVEAAERSLATEGAWIDVPANPGS
jgi:predicted dehydrogenase